jgi:hypothetical protein
MASIGRVNLSIGINGDNAQVRVRYTITFSEFDLITNLQYIEKCFIFGDDTNVGDFLAGGDDPILGGLIFGGLINPNGITSIARDFNRAFSRHTLNEDSGIFRGGGPENEIRAKVELTPRLPGPKGKESNLVRRDFGFMVNAPT